MNFKNIKSNQIILFVVALMLVSAGYLSYSMRGTPVSSNIVSENEVSSIGDARLVSSNNVIDSNSLNEVSVATSSSSSSRTDDYFASSRLGRDTIAAADFCSLAFRRQAPAAFRRVENVQFRRRDCSGNPKPDCGNSAFWSVIFVPYTGACGRNLSCGGAVCEKRLGKENGRLPFFVLHSLYLRTAHFFAAIRFDHRRSCGAYRVGVFSFQRAAPHALRRNQGGQSTGKARRSGNRVRTITEIYRKSFSCHL